MSVNLAAMYSDVKRVSEAVSSPSEAGYGSVTTRSLMTRVLNGLRCSLPKVILASIASPERASVTFSARYVWTAVVCSSNSAEASSTMTARVNNQNIFRIFLTKPDFKSYANCKNNKNIRQKVVFLRLWKI